MRTWEVLTAVWLSMLLGTGLVLVGMGAGWGIGRYRFLLGVRIVSWWLSRVIVPLLKSPSWWRRVATVFVNNICVLALLLAAGIWHLSALAAVAGLGVSLGVALRCLSREADGLILPPPPGDARARRRLWIGVALNMLEPPAIVVTLGLCLGQAAIPLAPMLVWQTFAVWILPVMLVAACGEALWMGVGRPAKSPDDCADTELPPPPVEP